MHLTLISPRLAIQKGDFLGSGIPYWPLELATLASHARNSGDQICLIDMFGHNPKRLTDAGDYYLQGVPIEEFIVDLSNIKVEAFVLYAISYMSHQELLSITKTLRCNFPNVPIVILENSQAVTAYSLQRMAHDFLDSGAKLLICGEAYFNWGDIKRYLVSNETVSPLNTISSNDFDKSKTIKRYTSNGEKYPIPAWDLINVMNYWSLPYSHGPKTKKYLPILTSRGCPYPCDFCVVPETNQSKWRGIKPEDVVDEIIYLRDRYDVYDFQIEDLNPTVQHQRWERICELLIERKANIKFYFVSGTKAETIRLDKVALFAKAGCRYLSISPESGSARLMKLIGKKFNYNHALSLIKACRECGIRTQACFLVGHPSESNADFFGSTRYLKLLVRAGLDEVAVFVVSPFAGSRLFENNLIKLDNSKLLASFTPKGRVDFKKLNIQRKMLISIYFYEKLKKGSDLWMQGIRALFLTPQTKMENLPKRFFYIYWLQFRFVLRSLFEHENDI